MGFIKRGVGEILPDGKSEGGKAGSDWTESDEFDLEAENRAADGAPAETEGEGE